MDLRLVCYYPYYILLFVYFLALPSLLTSSIYLVAFILVCAHYFAAIATEI